jgi:hypothetical protein
MESKMVAQIMERRTVEDQVKAFAIVAIRNNFSLALVKERASVVYKDKVSVEEISRIADEVWNWKERV